MSRKRTLIINRFLLILVISCIILSFLSFSFVVKSTSTCVSVVNSGPVSQAKWEVKQKNMIVSLGNSEKILHKIEMKESVRSRKEIRVAVGLGITSAGISITQFNIQNKFTFLSDFLPSFCRTLSLGYVYGIYMAYDWTDSFFTSSQLQQLFYSAFFNVISTNCDAHVIVSLRLVSCGYSGSPGWSQNDAMMAAYLDGYDYFYRINDDTLFVSKDWTRLFVEALRSHSPVNVGVVGPTHDYGKTEILTYDFVHRTHVEIFGFYYPRLFTDWFADDWISMVYEPRWMSKLSCVTVRHTNTLGRRYENNWRIKNRLKRQVQTDQVTLIRYIQMKAADDIVSDRSKVISMSLYSNCSQHINTVLRNCQLAPILYPDWSVRVYTTRILQSKMESINRTLERARSLGATVAYIEPKLADRVCADDWKLLALADSSVKHLLVSSQLLTAQQSQQRTAQQSQQLTAHQFTAQQSQQLTAQQSHKLLDSDWSRPAACPTHCSTYPINTLIYTSSVAPNILELLTNHALRYTKLKTTLLTHNQKKYD